jgi:hypothetical protein
MESTGKGLPSLIRHLTATPEIGEVSPPEAIAAPGRLACANVQDSVVPDK